MTDQQILDLIHQVVGGTQGRTTGSPNLLGPPTLAGADREKIWRMQDLGLNTLSGTGADTEKIRAIQDLGLTSGTGADTSKIDAIRRLGLNTGDGQTLSLAGLDERGNQIPGTMATTGTTGTTGTTSALTGGPLANTGAQGSDLEKIKAIGDLGFGNQLQSIPPGMDPREWFLQQTPGYNFAFNQGLRGIQSSAAARGTLLTGGTLRGIQRFGTGLADQLYGNTVDRLRDFATLGQRTATAPF